MCDCTTSEEKCSPSVSVTALSLSRAPIVTSATVGTPPPSARSLQVCVQQTERESLGTEIQKCGERELNEGGRNTVGSKGGW